MYEGTDKKTDIAKALNSTATFIFEGGIKKDTIATYPLNIATSEDFPKCIIPGKETTLSISATDDTQSEVSSPVYRLERDPEITSNITISPTHTIITNNIIKVHGPPRSKGKLIVTLLEQEDVAISFDIILDECPPGYVYNIWSSVCECSTDTERLYLGIRRCNLTVYRANLIPGYWAGYVGDDPSEGSFRTANCPLGYCRNRLNEPEILLPAKASLDISEVVCVSNRRGVMCGECKINTSTLKGLTTVHLNKDVT